MERITLFSQSKGIDKKILYAIFAIETTTKQPI